LTIFVTVTIALGLVLGLILVLFIDCICPPKKHSKEDREFKESDIGDESDIRHDSPEKAKVSDDDDKKDHLKKRAVKAKRDN